MSKADEMFEELGYEKNPFIDNKDCEYTKYIKDKCFEKIIDISSNKKEIWCALHRDGEYLDTAITFEELQAINEKVKELRMVR